MLMGGVFRRIFVLNCGGHTKDGKVVRERILQWCNYGPVNVGY